jgi:zinc protease
MNSTQSTAPMMAFLALASFAPALGISALVRSSSVPVHASSAGEQSKSGDALPWYCEKSDIPVDPRIHLGHLDNGMRCAWMANHEPRDRTYLRLDVGVGSLAEENEERGMAHYLEHMAFNGSKHFPAGTLVEWFQKHGMGFGADTNASTGFHHTIYQIDLPKSDKRSLEEGLGVFRDFADGLLLEQKEIDSERGVIDAEERERDTPNYRVIEQVFDKQYAGTRIPLRIPIGVKALRDAFTSEMIRKFYTKWYRPERMTLVLVGDLGELDPMPLVHAAFDDFRAPASDPPRLPAVGTPEPKAPAFCIFEKDLSSEEIHVERMTAWKERPENLAQWKSDLPLRCARDMLDLRFSELAKRSDAPFLGASAADAYETDLRVQGGEVMGVTCTPEKWKDALSFCAKELRRAIELGFDASQLSEVRADFLRSLDEAVEREKTRSSGSWVGSLLDAAENTTVPNNAETARRYMKPLLESLDVEACHKAFAEEWARGRLILSMAGDVDLGADGPKVLRETYEASMSGALEARKEAKSAEFAYATDASKAGPIAARKHIDEFDYEDVVFENGVKLHVKKTDFKEKQILVSAQVGEGRLSLDRGAKKDDASSPAARGSSNAVNALDWVTGQVFIACGLGKHSADDLRRLDAGKEVDVDFSIDADTFHFNGATTKEDLVRELELMRAYLVDPGWRSEGLEQFKKELPVLYDSFKKNPGGPLTTEFLPEFYSYAPRVEFPTREHAEAVTTDAMRAWLGAQFADAPIDLVIVGDVDVEAAVRAMAQTFGTLGKRRAPNRYEDRRTPAVLRSGLKREYEIESNVPKAYLLIAFPATDGRDA